MAVRYAIFCDDIRVEMSRKLIIIGCYADAMIVQRFPFTGSLAAAVALDTVDPNTPLRVQYRLSSGATIGGYDLLQSEDQDAEPSDLGLAPLPPVQFTLSSPDTIHLYVAIGEEEYGEVAKLHVRAGRVASFVS